MPHAATSGKTRMGKRERESKVGSATHFGANVCHTYIYVARADGDYGERGGDLIFFFFVFFVFFFGLR